MIDIRNSDLSHIGELRNFEGDGVEDLQWYGMDWYAPTPSDDGLTHVLVEDLNCSFNDEEMQLLSQIDPLVASDSCGIDIFMQCLEIVN